MKMSLKIHYNHRSAPIAFLVVLTLLAALLLGYLVWEQKDAAASNSPAPLVASGGMRHYYLTKLNYDGANADTVCATGYHMAALWEILEPSHLKYNSTLGFNARDDLGQGPPTFIYGWVRTGYSSSGSSTAGQGNCYNWNSSGGSDYGTYTWLPHDWTAGYQDLHVWAVGALTCSSTPRVWCVENSDIVVYLPVIMQNS